MSRCRAMFLASLLVLMMQTPAPAKVHLPHVTFSKKHIAQQSQPTAGTPDTGRTNSRVAQKAQSDAVSATTTSSQATTTSTSTATTTQPAVIEKDSDTFTPPDGALYTTSDECG